MVTLVLRDKWLWLRPNCHGHFPEHPMLAAAVLCCESDYTVHWPGSCQLSVSVSEYVSPTDCETQMALHLGYGSTVDANGNSFTFNVTGKDGTKQIKGGTAENVNCRGLDTLSLKSATHWIHSLLPQQNRQRVFHFTRLLASHLHTHQ